MRLKLFFFLLFFVIYSFSFGQTAKNDRDTITPNSNVIKELKTLDSLGLLAFMSGRFYDSFKARTQLLEKARAANSDYYKLKANSGLGYDYLEQNDTVSAEKCINKAREYAIKLKNDPYLGESYMILSFINFVKGKEEKINKAIVYMEKTIALNIKTGDTVNLTNTYYNYLNNIIKVNHLDKGEEIIEKINEFLPMVSKSRDSLLYIDYMPLAASYYNLKKDYSEAVKYTSPYLSDPNFKKQQFSLPLEKLYEEYSVALEGLKAYEESLKYSRLYDSIKSLNFQKQKSKETAEITAEFKVEEYREEKIKAEFDSQLKTEKIKFKSIINYTLIVGTIISLLFLLQFYFLSKKRKQLVKEVNIKNLEYLKAKEEAERLTKAKSSFFSTVSHELRTPLYGVIGLSTILLEDESLKSHEEDIKSLKFSADYLLALINDVLEINKIDSNKIENEQQVFSIKSLISTVLSSFEYMLIQNNNKIHISISENMPAFMSGNSIHLSRILINLIGNACKFTENGDIFVLLETESLSKNNAKIKFSVRDTGIGIVKSKQIEIFEEFTQANPENYNYQGSGLGLPIVSKLLKLSNSKIFLESDLGKGSLFYFTLSYDIVYEDEIAENEASKIIAFNTIPLKGKRILIVDDNRINQIVTKKILEKEEVICSIANNGQEAIEVIKKNEYDIVLMDINMPVKDGVQATKEVREFNTKIPIIALTAVEIEEVKHKIFDCGMTDFILKPYDIKKFKEVIIKNIIS
ncbi:response regulator [Lacinutrix sp.]|uniref:response regulator n=1 Tax=Lacinutrix sp. TaxID=1937692 RepID=UPI0025C5BBDF|nr:response regulator [Lacinutrix sp.]